MTNRGCSEIETGARPIVGKNSTMPPTSSANSVLYSRTGKQRQRAHLAKAAHALVDQPGESRTHFREGTELPAAEANLRADTAPFEPAPAVLRLQRQGRDSRVDVETIVREETELTFDGQPARELIPRHVPPSRDIWVSCVADAQGREMASDFQAARVGLRTSQDQRPDRRWPRSLRRPRLSPA